MNNIQHKFLVSADIGRWLKKFTSSIHKTEQFYTVSNAQETCYYHKDFPDTYTKIMVDNHGNKESVSVSEEEYTSQRKNHLGRIIVKKAYTVIMDGSTFVVEKYLKKLEGLYILIAYFQDEKAFRNSETIQELQSFVLKEIDQDDKYSDHSLAVYVKPMEYNVQKFFEKIDAFESPNLFFWQVPQHLYVRDGVSLVLYRNIRLINYYKMNFQKKHFSATLHRLRVLLRRTATLLEIFPDLFSPHVQRSCIDLLKRYYEETTLLRYLYFLNELCPTRENAKLTLYSELKSLITQEEEAVKQMLSSKPFRQMLNILTREIGVQEKQTYLSLQQEVKQVLKERLGRFEMLLGKTKEGYDDAELEALYIFVDSLQTLIEDFFHIIGEKESRMIVEELNILFKPLREYRNCKERAVILKNIKSRSETKTLDIDPLLCEHEEVLKDRIAHTLKLLRSSRFYV
jgi:CYTH domain-containing protein